MTCTDVVCMQVRTLSDQEAEILPVTLLGAVLDGDSILATADSHVWKRDGATGSSFRGLASKFEQLRGTKVIYAYYGDEEVGEPVRLQIVVSSWESWDELTEATVRLLTAANLAPLRSGQHPVSVMLAGYLGKIPGIYRIGAWGKVEPASDIAFLGNGQPVAEVAWAVAESIADISREERLRIVMGHTIAKVNPLGPPIRYWRVTAEKVRELDFDGPEDGGINFL